MNLFEIEKKWMLDKGWIIDGNRFLKPYNNYMTISVSSQSICSSANVLSVRMCWNPSEEALEISKNISKIEPKIAPSFLGYAELFRVYGYIAADQLLEMFFAPDKIPDPDSTINNDVMIYQNKDYQDKNMLAYIVSFTNKRVNWIPEGNYVISSSFETNDSGTLETLFWMHNSEINNILILSGEEPIVVSPEMVVNLSAEQKNWIFPPIPKRKAYQMAIKAAVINQPYSDYIFQEELKN